MCSWQINYDDDDRITRARCVFQQNCKKTAAEYGHVKYTEYYRKMRSMSNLISLTEMRYFQEN